MYLWYSVCVVKDMKSYLCTCVVQDMKLSIYLCSTVRYRTRVIYLPVWHSVVQDMKSHLFTCVVQDKVIYVPVSQCGTRHELPMYLWYSVVNDMKSYLSTCVVDKSLMECAACGDDVIISELSCRITSGPSGLSFAAPNKQHDKL